MMRKMGRRDGAIGFAVYLDAIASGKKAQAEYDVDILLLKNGADAASVLLAVEELSESGARVLATETVPGDIRAEQTFIMQALVKRCTISLQKQGIPVPPSRSPIES